MNTHKLLVCIPTYNEIDNIAQTISKVLPQIEHGHILIVDDNSPDGTGTLAAQIARENPRISVLQRPCKDGLGAAHLAAFQWGLNRSYDYFIQFDADGSHHPDHLPTMLAHLANYEMVIASRRVAHGGTHNWGVHRQLLSAMGSIYSKRLLQIPILDVTAGFNGFQRSLLERIDFSDFLSMQYFFQVELKYRCYHAGASYTEFPIIFLPRRHGQSKISPKIILDAALRTIQLSIHSHHRHR